MRCHVPPRHARLRPPASCISFLLPLPFRSRCRRLACGTTLFRAYRMCARACVCAGAVRAPSVMGRSPSSRFFQRRKSRSDFRHANREVDRPSMFAAGLSHSGEASVMGRSPSSRFFQRRKSRSDFRHANREVDRPSMFAAGLSHSGEAWLLLSVRITRLSGTHPIRVRRQALASVRGQRHGCQHHAWSKRVPRADLNSVLDRATAVRRTRRASCIIGTRVPARDTGRSSPSGALFPPPAVDCPWEARAPKPCEAPSPPRA